MVYMFNGYLSKLNSSFFFFLNVNGIADLKNGIMHNESRKKSKRNKKQMKKKANGKKAYI